MRTVPASLNGRAFTTSEALRAGVTSDELRGPSFLRLHRGVYVTADHDVSFATRVEAARLALPADAHLSHATRIRVAGLDYGPADPLHFTVGRDLHVTPSGIVLHRTKVMPPVDEVGVTPASAFIGVAATARLIDLIGIGDWLLHRQVMSTLELREIAHAHRWRPGAHQALAVASHLNARAASVPESETRAVVTFAGLPEPEVNVPIFDTPGSPITDLYFRKWRVALEYEGGHHLLDRHQIKRDAWRYAQMRDAGIEYVQIYAEMLAQPRTLATHVHRVLTKRGYEGPPPTFDRRWNRLFAPVRVRAVG